MLKGSLVSEETVIEAAGGLRFHHCQSLRIQETVDLEQGLERVELIDSCSLQDYDLSSR